VRPEETAATPRDANTTPEPARAQSAPTPPVTAAAPAATPDTPAAREETPAPAHAAEPAHATAVEAPAAKPASVTNAASPATRGNREFFTLPASAYVVELAHSARKADISALRESLALTHGDLYELHLRREGDDWWLLVWGTFDNVDSARSARDEIPTDAVLNAGWARRVGVLQAEARQVGP